MYDWDSFLSRLRKYPLDFHRILPPCPRERVEAVEEEFGKLPQTLADMLERFNGAKLFCCPNPIVNIFRISTIQQLPILEWAPEWCIDTFTSKWRAASSGRNRDWAVAMNNYGGLVLLDLDGNVKEWDIGVGEWVFEALPLEQWIEEMMSEGEAIMHEFLE